MANFTVNTGVTDTTAKTVSNNDIGTVQAGGALSDTTDITWGGGAAGNTVVIDNAGSITATTRAIDTAAAFTTGNFTLDNRATGVITSANDTFRVNLNAASGAAFNGKITVDNAGIMQSTTNGQVFDFASLTSQNATVDIHNESTGVIRALGDDAIRPGSGHITITNDGLIDSTASANRAINLNATNLTNIVSFQLTNDSTGTIQSQGDTVRITAGTLTATAVGAFALDNAGTIKSTGVGANNGQAIDFNDLVSTNGSVTITNEATGLIQAADADAVRAGANATVNNLGAILSLNGTPTSTGNDGLDFQGNKNGTINNGDATHTTALISGARHGITGDNPVTVTNFGAILGNSGSGINLDTAPTTMTTVTNHGTITGTSVDGDGDGVDVDGAITLDNFGAINAVGVHIADNVQEGLAIGGGAVNNHAGGTIHSFERAITVDDSNLGNAFVKTILNNEGTIQGDDGQAISITDILDDTITNKGFIDGSVAMGGGNDVFNDYTGSTLTSTVDGGLDTDEVNLLGAGTGTLSGFVNFEMLDVQGGVWTILDDESFASGTTIDIGATLQVGNGGTVGSLTSDVDDKGTFAFDRSDTLTFADTIAGDGTVKQLGSGTTVLSGHSSFTGGTQIVAGTLELEAADAAGTGDVSFDAGTLRLDPSALSNGHFANTIDGFAGDDTIDLAAIGLATSAVLGPNNVLTVSGGAGGPITLQLDPHQDFFADVFKVSSDGNGGTNVVVTSDDAPVAAADVNGVFFKNSEGSGSDGNGKRPFEVHEDAAHGVLANDSDPDAGDAIHVSAVNFGTVSKAITLSGSATLQGNFGTLVLGSDGSYTYTAGKDAHLPDNALAQDHFTYSVSDNHGGATQSSLTISVLDTNQQYVAGAPHGTLVGTDGKQVLDGGQGEQTLIAGKNDTVLVGGPNDVLIGGKGHDTFLFGLDFGKDTVSGFSAKDDTLQFDHGVFVSAADALAHTVSDGHGDTLIAHDANDVVTLLGVDAHSLTTKDFLIV
jgi:autotransporter-associated beta strand protein